MKNLPIYIATSDKTMQVLPALAYCMNKFWPNQKINILGFSQPDFKLPENFSYFSLGEMVPVNQWSTPIGKFINESAPDYFIFALDDHLPIKEVDQDGINWLVNNYCHKELGRIGLTNDINKRPCKVYTFDRYRIVIADQNAPYRVSTMYSIWNKQWFLNNLQPNMTPWKFEKPGPKYDGSLVVSTRGDYPIHMSHGVPTENCKKSWKECICDCGYKIDKESRNILQDLLP